MRAHVLVALLSVAVAPPVLFSEAALAQSDDDRATARALGQEGQAAIDRKDWNTAEDRFSRADKLFHAPTLGLGLARAYAGGGKLVAAQEAYNRLIREGVPAGAPAAFTKAVEAAREEVELITPRLAKVVVTVGAAGGGDVSNPHVTIDDKPLNNAALGVARVIDPGPHVVKVVADGFKASETRINLAEAGSSNVRVTLDRGAAVAVASTPPSPPSPTAPPENGTPPAPNPGGGTEAAALHPADDASAQASKSWPLTKTLGVVGMGVGGAGLVTGVITGVLAMSGHSSVKNKIESVCGGAGYCTAYGPNGGTYTSDESSWKAMASISTIGFIAGGVFAAAGVTMFIVAPKDAGSPGEQPKTATISPYFMPGAAGLVGTF